MIIEQLSTDNLKHLTALVLELWPECIFDEEYEQYKNLIYSETEACFLVKNPNRYIAFIHLSIRNDYVEGAYSLPVAYIEAVYVQPEYQKMESQGNWFPWQKDGLFKKILNKSLLTPI